MNQIHEIDFSNIRVAEILAEAEAQDIDWLPAHRDRILERAANPRAMTGFCLPWGKTHDKVRLRPGELSVWGGFNAHNKTTLVSQVALNIAQFAPVGIASLEMELEDTAVLLGSLAAGVSTPAQQWVNEFLTWSDNRISIYDRLDAVKPEIALACVYHMAANLGCKFIVLDSMMMCSVCDDSERERKFVSTLSGIAKMLKCHIALVHHMRKPPQKDESYIPNKFDFLGSSHITNLAMSVFICWHDKAKAEELEMAERTGDSVDDEKPDQLLVVAKQRHGKFEGRINLWQHESRQFTGNNYRRAQHIEVRQLETPA
ncbi:DnaB-like helicase C-terminal domain-containing protein [Parahaliea mediterranea]|uniref:DnaB-like helicase C-terminal domain-containing protein n=1 Tax=Parahaliea mediterranea TaxID=651086 RepID=UPI000E2F84BB|nr:DnaB-like helicase C-terminal domain-containing protein [Parahaliea mediterranea]